MWRSEIVRLEPELEEMRRFDDGDRAATEFLVYRARLNARIIEYHLADRYFPTNPILFEGFTVLPEEMNDRGYFKTGAVGAFLRRKLGEADVTDFVVSRTRGTGMRHFGGGRRLVLSYEDFQRVCVGARAVTSAYREDIRATSDVLFHDFIPRQFSVSEGSARSRLSRLLASMDESVISEMSGADIDRMVDFTTNVLDRRYTARAYRHRYLSGAKLKIDQVALADIISEFEEMLRTHHSEADWGRFLRRNLYLVESRYVHVLDRLNVITATTREADFGLVDTHGFLDIFEIKVPETTLLAATQDRGNHFWHTDATKAITQLEKYLYNTERRALTLEADIQRELNTQVSVTRPRALLILGNSGQLDTSSKREDLRVLRSSLKNIEIILYDELLERLRNMRDKSA